MGSEDEGIFEKKTNIQKRQHPKPVPTYTFIHMNQLKWVLSNFNFNREFVDFSVSMCVDVSSGC